MKLLFTLFGIAILMSCSVFNSTTYIEPANSFVLGQGLHGSYSASVLNSGDAEVEIIQNSEDGQSTSLGVLKKGSKSEYKVKSNTALQFKNLSATQAVLKIRLKGDTGLSMGYESK